MANLYDRINNRLGVNDNDLTVRAKNMQKSETSNVSSVSNYKPYNNYVKNQKEHNDVVEERNAVNDLLNVSYLPNEYQPIVIKAMALAGAKGAKGADPEEVKWKMSSAVLFSQNYGLPYAVALNKLDELSEYQIGQKAQYSQSWYDSIANSFRVGRLTTKQSEVAERLYWADVTGKTENREQILKELKEYDDEIAKLSADTPHNVFVQALDMVSQTLPYMYEVGKGNLAGSLVGAGIGSIIAPGAGTATGSKIGSIVGGFIQGNRMTTYRQYYEMLKAGYSQQTALWISGLSGALQAGIESILGIEAGVGRAFAKGQGLMSSFASKQLTNAINNGAKATTLTLLKQYGINVLSEGAEEFLQRLTENVSYIIADNLDQRGVSHSAQDVFKGTLDEFVGGAAVALILGLPNFHFNKKAMLKNGNTIKTDAINTDSKEEFIDRWTDKDHSEVMDNVFGDTEERVKRQTLSDIWDNFHKEQNKDIDGLETIDVDTDINDTYEPNTEDTNAEEIQMSVQPTEPIKRLDNGRLRVQESKSYSVNSDGTESHTMNIGTPNSTMRYGHIDYTLNEDTHTVTIDTLATKQGYEADITRDAVLELARQHEGWNIEWNPKTESQIKIKEELINNNPNNNGTLQYFNINSDNDTVLATSKLIRESFTNLNKEQSALASRFLEITAQAQDKDLKTWINDHIQEFKTTDEKGIKGKIEFDEKGIRAIISAGKQADFSTFAHETFHSLIRTSQKANLLVSALQESVGTEQFKNYVDTHKNIMHLDFNAVSNAIKTMGENPLQWNREQHEVTATLFEGYLKDGKTFSEKLKNIFAQIADWFKRIYRTLKNEGTLNDNIIKAYDSIFTETEESTINNSDSIFVNPPSESELNQVIGELGAYRIDTNQEVSIRRDNLEIAIDMEQAGKDAKTIKIATGWERGVDGKWRYEIPDIEVKKGLHTLTESDPFLSQKYYFTKLSDIIDGKDVFKAYPALENMKIYILPEMEAENYGFYANDNIYIKNAIINKKEITPYDERITEIENSDIVKEYISRFKDLDEQRLILKLKNGDESQIKKIEEQIQSLDDEFDKYPIMKEYDDLLERQSREKKYIRFDFNTKLFKDTLSHEIQHAIQHIEGFAPGGNIEMFSEVSDYDKFVYNFDLYPRLYKGDELLNKLVEALNDDIYKEKAKELTSERVSRYGEVFIENPLEQFLSEVYTKSADEIKK